MIRILAISLSLVGLGLVLYLLFSKKQKPWNDMTGSEQNRKKLLLVSGTTVFLAGLLAAIFISKKK